MAEFIWIEHNRYKVDSHSLSTDEVEHAWETGVIVGRGRTDPEHGPSFVTVGVCPSGRVIEVFWRYNVDWDGEEKVFVINAY